MRKYKSIWLLSLFVFCSPNNSVLDLNGKLHSINQIIGTWKETKIGEHNYYTFAIDDSLFRVDSLIRIDSNPTWRPRFYSYHYFISNDSIFYIGGGKGIGTVFTFIPPDTSHSIYFNVFRKIDSLYLSYNVQINGSDSVVTIGLIKQMQYREFRS
ncbi:MAG: hypothetical protein PHG23_02790 [Candidatus Pacebacteria bacterium]|nr:hypothetical protein [Candidatus Paceibacterota bacterium]